MSIVLVDPAGWLHGVIYIVTFGGLALIIVLVAGCRSGAFAGAVKALRFRLLKYSKTAKLDLYLEM